MPHQGQRMRFEFIKHYALPIVYANISIIPINIQTIIPRKIHGILISLPRNNWIQIQISIIGIIHRGANIEKLNKSSAIYNKSSI